MTADLARIEDDRHWDNLTRKATALAKAGALVPKAIQGNPDAALAACLILDAYGVAITPITIKQLHFMPDGPEPSAQLQAGMLGAHGYTIDWIEIGNQRCEARLVRPDGTVTTSIEWTIDQARTAGLLDEWVERWVGFKRADGSGGNRLEKFVLGRTGVDTPDWVTEQVRAGATKRSENWHRYPDDMLASKVVRRLVKRFAGQAMLGVGIFDDLDTDPSPAGRVVETDPPAGEDPGPDDSDDGIVDAEVLGAGPPPGPGTTARAGTGGRTCVSGDWVQRFALTLREAGIGDDGRHALVDHVTAGRTRSAKGLWRSEIPAARATFARIQAGELAFAEVDGQTAVVLGSQP